MRELHNEWKLGLAEEVSICSHLLATNGLFMSDRQREQRATIGQLDVARRIRSTCLFLIVHSLLVLTPKPEQGLYRTGSTITSTQLIPQTFSIPNKYPNSPHKLQLARQWRNGSLSRSG
jgi:hypothetical protein